MLSHLLLFLLLVIPGPWAVPEASSSCSALRPALPSGTITFQVLQTNSFFSLSSSDVEVLALLRDVETNTLDWSTRQFRFLQPWVFPVFTPKEWADLELLASSYLNNLIHMVNQIVQQRALKFPLVVQCSMGCWLGPNGTASSFYDAGFGGQDFISFSVRNGSWTRRRDDDVARYVEKVLNNDEGTRDMLLHVLNVTFVKTLHKLVQSGKEALERQVKPMAVVFARPSGPGSLLLVCRVTGFYPRPVRIHWLRDGQEVAPGPELSSTPILPNADLTYQLRSALVVATGDGRSYACRVQHSSLGDRSLLVPWESSKTGLVAGIVVAVLVIVAAAVAGAFWWWRRRNYEDVDASQPRDSILYRPEQHLPSSLLHHQM